MTVGVSVATAATSDDLGESGGVGPLEGVGGSGWSPKGQDGASRCRCWTAGGEPPPTTRRLVAKANDLVRLVGEGDDCWASPGDAVLDPPSLLLRANRGAGCSWKSGWCVTTPGVDAAIDPRLRGGVVGSVALTDMTAVKLTRLSEDEKEKASPLAWLLLALLSPCTTSARSTGLVSVGNGVGGLLSNP